MTTPSTLEITDYFHPEGQFVFADEPLSSPQFEPCRLSEVVFVPYVLHRSADFSSIMLVAYRKRVRIEKVMIHAVTLGGFLEENTGRTLSFGRHPVLPCLWAPWEVFPSVSNIALAHLCGNAGFDVQMSVTVGRESRDLCLSLKRRFRSYTVRKS